MTPSSDESQSKTYCTPFELSEADERMKRFYGRYKMRAELDGIEVIN